MALTRYKILTRLPAGDLRELGVQEAHSPEQALRNHVKEHGGSGPFVATPEGNWNERVPQTKTVTTISFLDADGDVVTGGEETTTE